MRRLPLVLLLGLATVVGVAACAGSAGPTFPAAGVTPPPAGSALDATRARVVAALGTAGLSAADAQSPYRPAEAARLAAAPRRTLQVKLPQDPDHGYVVLYDLGSPEAAQAAAADEAAYLGTSVGRIQFPVDSRFVLRVLGSAVVFFAWSPGSSPDPQTRSIEDALGTLGTGVQIPS